MKRSEPIISWYLLQVKPNGYKLAERNLLRQGFPVFSPLQTETSRNGGLFRTSLRPLFPGYMFVGIDPGSAPWRAINSTSGVSRLLALGGADPAALPHELVSGLMARCDGDGKILSSPELEQGDAVRIASGPFADFVSTVDSIEADKRIWVLIDLMGRPTKVALDASDLEKL